MFTMLSTLEPRVTDSVNDVVNLIDVNEVKDYLVTGVGMCGVSLHASSVSVSVKVKACHRTFFSSRAKQILQSRRSRTSFDLLRVVHLSPWMAR